MVDFGGWDMPLQYSGILEEHHAVRRGVGVFDVSHMGEIEIRGPEAIVLADFVTTNRVAALQAGHVQYSGLLNENGGFVDDILVHRVSDDEVFLCVNASNQDGDFEHISGVNRFDAHVEFASPRYAQIAVQGPRAIDTLQPLVSGSLATMRYYTFVDATFLGRPARIARTGYTGEIGFEIYLPPQHAEEAWVRILDSGREFDIKPCGLGARNTLRLEAAMALYGHEIDANTTPFEAGLDWIVKLDKGEFIGREALLRQRECGVSRKLTAFEMVGRGIARDGYEVFINERLAGRVTSGGPSPTLNKNIGLCYLPAAAATAGRRIDVSIRGQMVGALTVKAPFYRRM
jgi:aminomethyltransferase